jgi:hypothetical protein
VNDQRAATGNKLISPSCGAEIIEEQRLEVPVVVHWLNLKIIKD